MSPRCVQKGLGLERGDVFGGLGSVWMVRAAYGRPPSLDIAAVAASAGLWGNEEADIVVCVVGRLEAART